MTEKAVNYTDSMVTRLREVYDGSATEVERDAQIVDLANELGRSVPSIRSKLTREGLYVAKSKAPSGKNTVRKAELVAQIADRIEMDVDAAGSLEKVTKAVLNRLITALG